MTPEDKDNAFLQINRQFRIVSEEFVLQATKIQLSEIAAGRPQRLLMDILKAEGFLDAAKEKKLRAYLGGVQGEIEGGLWRNAKDSVFDLEPVRTESGTHVMFNPVPVTVKVDFRSRPTGAGIWIDGAFRGRTAQKVDIAWRPKDAPKKVLIRLGGYADETRELKRADQSIDVELTEIVEERALRLTVEPAGSTVEVNGVALGWGEKAIPLQWSVTRVKYTLKISHPGYKPQVLNVTREGVLQPIRVVLNPLPKGRT